MHGRLALVLVLLALVAGGCSSNMPSGTSSGTTSSSSTSSGSTSGSAGACDGNAHCSSDGSGTETCTMQDGIPVSTTVTCAVGKCKSGACGACGAASDCKVALICSCKDGSNQGVTESGTCPSDQCICSWGSCTSTSSVCPAKCADHGGWNGS